MRFAMYYSWILLLSPYNLIDSIDLYSRKAYFCLKILQTIDNCFAMIAFLTLEALMVGKFFIKLKANSLFLS